MKDTWNFTEFRVETIKLDPAYSLIGIPVVMDEPLYSIYFREDRKWYIRLLGMQCWIYRYTTPHNPVARLEKYYKEVKDEKK